VIDRESHGKLGLGNDDSDDEGEEDEEGENKCKRVNFYTKVKSKYTQ